MLEVMFAGFAGVFVGTLFTYISTREFERKRVFREVIRQFSEDWSEIFRLMAQIRYTADTESAIAFMHENDSSLLHAAYRFELVALLIDQREIDVKLTNRIGLAALAIEFLKHLEYLNSQVGNERLDLDFYPHLRNLANRFNN